MSYSWDARCTVQKAFSRTTATVKALIHIQVSHYRLDRIKLVVFGVRDSSLCSLDHALGFTVTFGVLSSRDSVEDLGPLGPLFDGSIGCSKLWTSIRGQPVWWTYICVNKVLQHVDYISGPSIF